MWYDFFLGKISRSWGVKEQDKAIVELKTHMMRLEKQAPAYDAKGIDVVLREMGFDVEQKHVQQLWQGLKQRKSIEVGHAMETLAEEICEHVSFDRRRAALSKLWPASSRKAIPDKNEEAIFDRVASLLGFSDKNFLDSCIKHRMQRSWELSESEVHCVVAELLLCMVRADGTQENRHLYRIIAHGFQMDVAVVHQMLTRLDELEASYDVDQAKGLEQFERERQSKIDALAEITTLSKADVDRKFRVLIDVPRFDSKNTDRMLKLLVEKLRYSLDDYGHDRLLKELQEIASEDGDFTLSEDSVFARIEALLASAEENATG